MKLSRWVTEFALKVKPVTFKLVDKRKEEIMTTAYPLEPAKLRIKLEAEAIDALQSTHHMPEGPGRDAVEIYAEKLNVIAENLQSLLNSPTEEQLVERYSSLKKNVQDRIDCLVSVEASSIEAITRNSGENRASAFLLSEIIKMGI